MFIWTHGQDKSLQQAGLVCETETFSFLRFVSNGWFHSRYKSCPSLVVGGLILSKVAPILQCMSCFESGSDYIPELETLTQSCSESIISNLEFRVWCNRRLGRLYIPHLVILPIISTPKHRSVLTTLYFLLIAVKPSCRLNLLYLGLYEYYVHVWIRIDSAIIGQMYFTQPNITEVKNLLDPRVALSFHVHNTHT